MLFLGVHFGGKIHTLFQIPQIQISNSSQADHFSFSQNSICKYPEVLNIKEAKQQISIHYLYSHHHHQSVAIPLASKMTYVLYHTPPPRPELGSSNKCGFKKFSSNCANRFPASSLVAFNNVEIAPRAVNVVLVPPLPPPCEALFPLSEDPAAPAPCLGESRLAAGGRS